MTTTPLAGAWRLTEQVEQWADGRRAYPRGESALGLIMYSPSGWMNAILSRTPARTGRDLGSLDYAMEDLLAYGGRFTLDDAGDSVQHHVQVCSYAPWEGTDLLRAVAYPAADTLQLTAARLNGGAERRLTWQRPDKGASRMNETVLVGAWLLEEYIGYLPNGNVEYPMGRQPYGLLHYGADGWMSVIISRRDRSSQHPYGSDSFAYNEFICYYGSYTVDIDAGSVIHRTAFSSYGPMHQMELSRALVFKGPDLIALTAHNATGQLISLTWRRQPPANAPTA